MVLVSGGVILLAALYIFGRTVPVVTKGTQPVAVAKDSASSFNIRNYLSTAKNQLPPTQQAYVNSLESSVVRGDVKNQQLHTFHQLANFWKDSAQSFTPFAYYTAEASKLENSEKSLTFAAQLYLNNLRGAPDPVSKSWMASQARDLFEMALKLNPGNDSAKIGLGSSYIFGSPASDPQQLMKGIQQILEVSRRDSTNMYAQLMLGIGGMVSGQFDKAIERLLTVISAEPQNMEAILTLAEAYEQKGDKANAVKWYEASKKLIANPEVIKEIDERIKSLH